MVHNCDLDYYKPCGVPRSGRFLFLARFSRIKGASLAIDACKKAGVGLDLVGDTSITNEPDYLEECRQKCDGRNGGTGLTYGIRMVGPAMRGECVRWFSQAHALVHANKLFREPLGLAPLESQACGTPVIAWDFGAMRETVKHGETGLLVKSFDDLVIAVNILRDKSDHAMGVMRADCRAWVEAFFPLDRMISRCEELINEATQTGGW